MSDKGYRIKKLEWSEPSGRRTKTIYAATTLFNYTIWDDPDDDGVLLQYSGMALGKIKCQSLPAAQAAAQAHFEDRVKLCLEEMP